MTLLRDEYKLASYVYSVQDTSKKLTYPNGGIGLDEAWKKYGKLKKIPEKEAIYIGASADGDGYVQPLASVEDDNTYTVVLQPGNGTRLLEKGAFGLPVGLFKAWLNINHVFTNLIWIVIGVILANLGTILGWARHLIHHQ